MERRNDEKTMSSHKSIIDFHRMSLNFASHSRFSSSLAIERLTHFLWFSLTHTLFAHRLSCVGVYFYDAMMSDGGAHTTHTQNTHSYEDRYRQGHFECNEDVMNVHHLTSREKGGGEEKV